MRFTLLLVGLSALGCASRNPPHREPPASVVAVAAPPVETLGGDWLEELKAADGHGAGSVAIPIGAHERRPLVVAVHGAGGRPDGMCSAARAALGPYPFIVCPHPSESFDVGRSWGSPAELRRAIDRSVHAAQARFPAWLDASEPLYLGHSQGAMLAPDALALPSDVQFRTAIFFEGLPRDANRAKKELEGTHIERLLLVSGQSGWAWGHDLFAKSLAGTSVTAKHVHVKNNGHFFTPAINDGIRNEIEWIAPWKPMT